MAGLTHGDAIVVVFAHEHHRQIPDGCHIQSLMESALVGRTVAKETGAYLIRAAVARRKPRSDRDIMTRAHDAVGAQNAAVAVGDMHRAAFALAVAGRLSKQLRHHVLQIAALRDDMPMTAVRAGNIIVVSKAFAYAGGNGFLAEVQMHKAGDPALSKKALCLVFKLADTYHPKVHIHHSFFSNIHSNSLLIDFLMCFRRCAAAV